MLGVTWPREVVMFVLLQKGEAKSLMGYPLPSFGKASIQTKQNKQTPQERQFLLFDVIFLSYLRVNVLSLITDKLRQSFVVSKDKLFLADKHVQLERQLKISLTEKFLIYRFVQGVVM